MTTNVLILHKEAAALRSMLESDFPDVAFTAVEMDSPARSLPPGAESLLENADAIMSFGRWLTPELLARCRRLAWFQCLITGVDHLLPVLAGSDVTLTNARGIHGPQMTELTILHMMAAYRQIPRLVRNQADHRWDRFRPRVLKGRAVTILGVGSIAEQVGLTCQVFGMKTIGVSRTLREVPGFDRIVPREQLLEAVAEADFVVVLLPHTHENDRAVGASIFDAMKPSAYLINVSRGGVVDEEALIEAVAAGRIAGAGLDVFSETPLSADSPLWDLENVFITPFVGGQSDRYEEDVMTILKPNLRAFRDRRPSEMLNVVPVSN